MKIAKKTLSVFLSFLMVMTSISVAFAALNITAAAANEGQTFKNTLTSQVVTNIINKGSEPNDGTFTYTGDDGSVMRAFDAAVAYINSVRSTDSGSDLSTQRGIYNKAVADLGLTGDTATAARKLIYPNGTNVVLASAPQKNTATRKNADVNFKDSWYGDVHKIACSTLGNASSLDRKVRVVLDTKAYLLTFDNVSQIPASFNTDVQYTFTYDDQGNNSHENKKANGYPAWKWNFSRTEWHYGTSFSGLVVNSKNITAKTQLTNIKNFYDTYVNHDASFILNKGATGEWNLPSLRTQGVMYANQLSSYTSDVADKLIGDDSLTAFATFNGSDAAQLASKALDAKPYVENIYAKEVEYNALVANADSWMVDGDAYVAYRDKLDKIARSIRDSISHLTQYTQDVFDLLANTYAGDAQYIGFTAAALGGVHDDDKLIAASKFTVANANAALNRIDITLQKTILRNVRVDAIARMDANEQAYDDVIAILNDPTTDNTDYSAYVSNALLAIASVDSSSFFSLYISPINKAMQTIGATYVDILTAAEYQRITGYDQKAQTVKMIREGEDSFEEIYIGKRLNVELFANIDDIADASLIDYYTNGFSAQRDVNDAYNTMKTKLGQQIADGAFRVTYNKTQMLLQNVFAERLKDIRTELQARDDQIIAGMQDTTNKVNAGNITMENYSLLKGSFFTFSTALWDFAEQQGWHSVAEQNLKKSYDTLKTQIDTVAQNLLKQNWTQYHGHNGNSFTVREAEKVDANGNLIYPDFARDGRYNDEDYDVTVQRVDETVVRLDTFLTSADFVKTVGLKEYVEYAKDENGDPIYKKDANGNKIVAKDDYGDIIYENDGVTPTYERETVFTRDINNISEYIETLLVRKLFTNDMITMLLVSVYPMVTNLLMKTVLGQIAAMISKDGIQLASAASGSNIDQSKRAITIDISKLAGSGIPLVGGLKGTAGAYLDDARGPGGSVRVYGKGNTSFPICTYEELFSYIGVNVFPSQVGNSLPSKFSALKTKLGNCGRDWSALVERPIAADEEYYKYDKVTSMTWNGSSYDKVTQKDTIIGRKVLAEDVEKYLPADRWGVDEGTGPNGFNAQSSYSTFCTAMGYILDPLSKILRSVLGPADLLINTDKAAAYLEDDNEIDTDKLGVHVKLGASAKVAVSIPGINLFDSILVQLFEDLGVAESGFTPDLSRGAIFNGSGTNSEYQFRQLTETSTTAQMVTAILEPVLVLIDQIKDHPLQRICELLPNLLFFLSSDRLTDIINEVKIPLSVTAKVDKLDYQITGFWSGLNLLAQWLNGTLKDLINKQLSFNFTLELNSILDIKDVIPFDYTDINAIIQFVFGSLGWTDVAIPPINSGLLISEAAKVTKDSQSDSRSTRTYLQVQTHEIFYYLIQYVMEVIGNKRVINSIYQKITKTTNNLDPKITAILDQVAARPDDALAAIVELFVPNEDPHTKKSVYRQWDLDWYQSNLNDAPVASKIYISDQIYGGNWTKDVAKGVVYNLNDTINTIISAAGGTTQVKDLGTTIKDMIYGLFTGASIVSPIRIMTELGEKLKKQDLIVNMVKDQTGIDLTFWYRTFRDLFLFNSTDPDAEPDPNVAHVVYNYTLDGKNHSIEIQYVPKTATEKGTYTTKYDGVDYDTITDDNKRMTGYASMICGIFESAAPILGLLTSGTDLNLFAGGLTLKGFEGYKNGIYDLLKIFGVPCTAPSVFERNCVNADGTLNYAGCVSEFNTVVTNAFGKITSILTADDMIAQVLDLVQRVVYYIESNGLSVLIHNLLQPIFVLVDIVRPLVNVDVNDVLNYLLTILLPDAATAKKGDKLIDISKIDLNGILGRLLHVKNNDDVTIKYDLNIWDLRLESIFKLVDEITGTTDLRNSPFITYGVLGLCQNFKTGKNVYKTLDPEDVVTIVISTLIETLTWGEDDGRTINIADSTKNNIPLTKSNGHLICEFIEKFFDIDLSKLGPNVTITGLFDAVVEVFKGFDIGKYSSPKWFYAYHTDDVTTQLGLAYNTEFVDVSNSAVYLNYITNWSKPTAETLDSQLTTIINSFIKTDDPNVNVIQKAINDLLDGKVYTANIFKSLIEMVYNLVNGSYRAILEMAGPILGIGVDDFLRAWGDFDPATNTYTLDLTRFDTAFDFDHPENLYPNDPVKAAKATKRDVFLKAFETVLAPVDGLLSFVLFGSSYNFFTSSERNADGSFKYTQQVNINGGDGYSASIAYLLEALGVENLKAKEDYANSDGSYNCSECIADILNGVLDLLDNIAENPIDNALPLLLNVIYFINADGLTTVIQNLLLPVEKILGAVAPVIGKNEYATIFSLVKSILKDQLDADMLSKIDLDSYQTMSDLLNFSSILDIVSAFTGIKFSAQIKQLLREFYLGRLEYVYSDANKDNFFMRMAFNNNKKLVPDPKDPTQSITVVDPTVMGTRADFETILIEIVLETILSADNKPFVVDLLAKLLKCDATEAALKYDAVIQIITGKSLTDADFVVPNFDYLADAKDTALDTDLTHLQSYVNTVNADPSQYSQYSLVYIQDNTDWHRATAEQLVGNLDALINNILPLVSSDPDYASIATLLNKVLNDNIYGDESILNNIAPLIVDALAGLSDKLMDAAGLSLDTLYGVLKETLGVDIAAWADMCEYVDKLDKDGNPVLDKNGNRVQICQMKADKKIKGVTPQNFGTKLAQILHPIAGIINWLFFGADFTFFVDSTKAPIITLKGGYGWKNSLMYLTTALGLTGMRDSYANADLFIEDLGTSLSRFLSNLGDEPVAQIIKILPNLFYFIGADGLTTFVANLLKPVTTLLYQVNTIAGKELIDINGLIGKYGLSYDSATGTLPLGWDEIFGILENPDVLGIKIPAEAKNALSKLYVGELTTGTDGAGRGYVKMDANTAQSRGDFLTIVICALGDVIRCSDNKQKFMDLLKITEDQFDALMSVLDGEAVAKYDTPSWGYFDNDYQFDPVNFAEPDYPDVNFTSFDPYLTYKNNWTKGAAETVSGILGSILDMLAPKLGGAAGDGLGQIIINLLSGKLYTDSTYVSIVETIYNLVANFDVEIVRAVGLLLGQPDPTTGIVPTEKWLMDYGTQKKDANGKVTGYQFDATKLSGKFTEKTFVADIVNLLKPLDKLLNFLLLGDSITLFNSTQASSGVFLTLRGGDGYSQALVYLLEALGCENLKPATAYTQGGRSEAGVEALLTDVLNSVLAKPDAKNNIPAGLLYKLCATNDNDAFLDNVLDLVTNLFYFINADGLGVVVDNLIAPVTQILEKAGPLTGGKTSILVFLKDVLKDNLGLDIGTATTFKELLTFKTIFGILESKLGIYIPKNSQLMLENFYIGHIVKVTDSATGFPTFKMVLNKDVVVGDEHIRYGTRADLITMVISLLLDIVEDSRNRQFLKDTLNFTDDQIDGLLTLYSSTGSINYEKPNWTTLDNSDDKFLGKNVTRADLDAYVAKHNVGYQARRAGCPYLSYDNLWDSDSIEPLIASVDTLVDYVLDLAKGTSLGKMANDLIADNVFGPEKSLLIDVVEKIANLIADFQNYLSLIDVVLGTTVNDYLTKYCTPVTTVDAKGNSKTEYKLTDAEKNKLRKTTATTFGDALAEAVKPLNPVLEWLFLGKDFTFFYDADDGLSQLYLKGAYGYTNVLSYIFEMLGVTLEAPAAFNQDGSKMMKSLGDRLAARLTDLLAKDTVSALLEILPNIVYFIESNGLGTIVNNLIAPLQGILDLVNGFLDADKQVSVDGLLYTITNMNELKGVDITKLTLNDVVVILKNFGITVPLKVIQAVKGKSFATLSVGTGLTGDKVECKAVDEHDKLDFLTVVIEVALDVVRDESNRVVITNLLGNSDKYNAIRDILDGKVQTAYSAPNWGYMDSTYNFNIRNLDNPQVPMYPSDITQSVIYNAYNKHWSKENNWNQATAELIMDKLNTILEAVLKMLGKDDLATILKNLLNDNLYSPENFDKVFKLIYEKLASFDGNILQVAGVICKGDSLTKWLTTYGTKLPDGSYIYNKNNDWTAVTTPAGFADTLTNALAPLDYLINWLFLGGDLALFARNNGKDAIVIHGGEGYRNGLVYILEALGCENLPIRTTSSTPAEIEKGLINSVLALADKICADPIHTVLGMLPNILYFINNGGLGASVDNILACVDSLVAKLTPFFSDYDGTGDTASLIALLKPTLEKSLGVTLQGKTVQEIVTMPQILSIVETVTAKNGQPGLKVPANTANVLEKFFIGEIVPFKSSNRHSAFRMQFTDFKQDSATLLTVLVGIVADIARYSTNMDVLRNLLGNDNAKYIDAVENILSMTNYDYTYTPFNWRFSEYADQTPAKIITAINESRKYKDPYANQSYWTKEMSYELVSHLDRFIGNLICLLGINLNGKKVEKLDEIVENLLLDKVYTKANVESIINLINDKLIAMIVDKLGQDLADDAIELIKNMIGVDLNVYKNMTIDFEVNSAATFEKALVQVLTPLLPLLAVVLSNKPLSFFYDYSGRSVVTVPGADGYALGIIPLFEALGVKSENIMSPTKFKAMMNSAVESDNPIAKEGAVKAILDPLFGRIDEIAGNPIEEVFAMLPELVYFINIGGVDVVIHNIVGGIDAVLEALEPVTGTKLQLTEIIKIKGTPLKDIIFNFEAVVDFVLGLIKQDTGIALKPIVMDAVTELTVGTLVSYNSANEDKVVNEHYYKMLYTTGDGNTKEQNQADMLTVILRILIDFITDKDNMAKIKELLKSLINNDKTFGYIEGLLDAIAGAKKDDPTLAMALQLIFKLYQALEKAVDTVDVGVHDYNNTWGFLVKMISTSDEPLLKYFGLAFKEFLNTSVDGDLMDDTHAVAPNGFIRFFQKIKELFQKIGEFFKKLFKINK